MGSSEWEDRVSVFSALDTKEIHYLVSGGSETIDEITAEYCKRRGIPQIFFYPKTHDKEGKPIKGAVFTNWKRMISVSTHILVFSTGSQGTAKFIDHCKLIKFENLEIIEVKNG